MTKIDGVGMNFLTAVVITLFTIGIFVMVFVLAGSQLTTTIANAATGAGTEGDFNLTNGTANTLTDCDGAFQGTGSTAATVTNATDGATVDASNYTVLNCGITGDSNSAYADMLVNITYAYTYTSNPDAVRSINDSTASLTDVPDWFPTFAVLAAVVVLILFIVVIIRSIRGTGFGSMKGKGGGDMA